MRIWSVRVLICTLLTITVGAQEVRIGEHIDAIFETDHPYPKSQSVEPVLSRTDLVVYPDATYIALHFAQMDLAPGDFVVVRSPDQKQHWVYTGYGRHDLGNTPEGFFATHIKGDTAVVELFTVKGDEQRFGYVIDFFGRGYNQDEIRAFWAAGLGEEMNLAPLPDDTDSLCTTDDTREAKCYQTSDPDAYDKARAVARLMKNGNAHCTGWLVGNEGHFMTNEHCIGSQSELNTIDFEFMAEGPDCATNCASSLACPGVVEASGGTMVQYDSALDYAMVIPDTSVAQGTDLPATYGYMQLRESGAVVGERLYIAQHPAGWGKRIAMESTYPGDPSGFPTVISITEPPCSGGPGDVGYWADTQGGSSGSPVLGYSDNKIIALHHCRGSAFCSSGNPGNDDPNRGVPIQDIIADLGPNLPPSAVCPAIAVPGGLDAQPNGPMQIDLSWSSVAGMTYNVYRGVGTCPGIDMQLLQSNIAQTTYSDTGVSGEITYAYSVTAVDVEGCESEYSTCASATATGPCTLQPLFDGLASATNAYQTDCGIQLSWDPAEYHCPATVAYNIYRSQSSGFIPSPATLIQPCLPMTEYLDQDVQNGEAYFYIVRAEDFSGNGSGPCSSGNEDGNLVELSARPSGPDALLFEDDMESGPSQWSAVPGPEDPGGTAPFSLVDTASASPTHSWFCPSLDDPKDQTLQTATPIVLPVAVGIRLEFFHTVEMEDRWDGCVLEYSTDGSNWYDILEGNGGSIPANANRFLENGYNMTLNSSTTNPLSQRQAWSGDLGGFHRVIVDLADFSDQSVSFRWRLGCDGSVTDEGWWVDDVRVFYATACQVAEPPDFSMSLWRNPPEFHSFYDFNRSGTIDVSDLITHMFLNP